MTAALLIIDVQNAILHGEGTAERQSAIDAALDAVAARLGRMQAAARAAGAPVILVQHDDPSDQRLAKGAAGWELRPEIAPLPGEPVVHKQSCDAFFETDLGARLAERGVTRLVIGGCMTEFCVDTTTRRAVSLGYDVTLIADGHTTADMGALRFEQIVAHHNAILDGFGAGAHKVAVRPAAEIRF